MSQREFRNVAEEYACRIWNKKDLIAIQELIHPKIIIHSLLGDFVGQEAMKNIVTAWLEGFPDLSIKNIATICEQDLVVIQWQASGIHQGKFMNIKPTGKSVSYQGVSIYRVKDNKITEYWAYLDMQHLLNQMR